jgi:hypothetical protein
MAKDLILFSLTGPWPGCLLFNSCSSNNHLINGFIFTSFPQSE